MDAPVVVADIFILFAFIFRIPLARLFFDTRKTQNYDRFLKTLNDVKFKLGDWKKTILSPILIISILYFIWFVYYRVILKYTLVSGMNDSIQNIIAFNLILAPFTEEIIQGFVLSFAYCLSRFANFNEFKTVSVALLLISIILAFGHQPWNFTSIIMLSILFIVYGVIYYLNDRNLLPAIVAHIMWNLLSAFVL